MEPKTSSSSAGSSASRSSWFLRVFVLVAAWFSLLMTAASFQQYFSFKNADSTLDEQEQDAIMARLQIPSMFGHPFFAIPALLLGHFLKPGFRTTSDEEDVEDEETGRLMKNVQKKNPPVTSKLDWIFLGWSFLGAVGVFVLYLRSLMPGVGMVFPGALIDVVRTLFYATAVGCVGLWAWRMKKGEV